jgi:hypothetical protein
MGVVMGVMGTTGASMVLVHPLLRANAHRRRKVHLVLFLIVLVADASGALTPLGNPPLYLGLLRGVPFFWPASHLFAISGGGGRVAGCVLPDRLVARGPGTKVTTAGAVSSPGLGSVALIVLVILVVFAQGFVTPRNVVLFGQPVAEAPVGVAIVLLAVSVMSAMFTRAIRQANGFTWLPMVEVAILFAAIFVTIAPWARCCRRARQVRWVRVRLTRDVVPTLAAPARENQPLGRFQGSSSESRAMKALTPAHLTLTGRSLRLLRLAVPAFRPQPRELSDGRFVSRLSANGYFQASPSHEQARHSFPPKQVRHPRPSPGQGRGGSTDCRFTSGWSPPRLAATQSPSITEPATGSRTDFHRADKASSRTHSWRGLAPTSTSFFAASYKDVDAGPSPGMTV